MCCLSLATVSIVDFTNSKFRFFLKVVVDGNSVSKHTTKKNEDGVNAKRWGTHQPNEGSRVDNLGASCVVYRLCVC